MAAPPDFQQVGDTGQEIAQEIARPRLGRDGHRHRAIGTVVEADLQAQQVQIYWPQQRFRMFPGVVAAAAAGDVMSLNAASSREVRPISEGRLV